jgi:hypothetical protein
MRKQGTRQRGERNRKPEALAIVFQRKCMAKFRARGQMNSFLIRLIVEIFRGLSRTATSRGIYPLGSLLE